MQGSKKLNFLLVIKQHNQQKVSEKIQEPNQTKPLSVKYFLIPPGQFKNFILYAPIAPCTYLHCNYHHCGL